MRKRPSETVPSLTTRIPTGHGRLYVTISLDKEGKPFDVVATIGKSGRSITAKAEATGRLVSLALRHDIPLDEIISEVLGIGGSNPIPYKGGIVLSIPDAIGQVLQRLKDGKLTPDS